jgi:uncharacterized protein YkwD
MTLALAAAVVALPCAGAAAKTCPGATTVPTKANLATVRGATLCLLNAERTKRGLTALRLEADLTTASSAYSRQMVAQHFFAHVSPGGSSLSSRVEKTGYLTGATGWSLGENIAWGGGALSTPAHIVGSWMGSPPHRHNILDAGFTAIGIGIAAGTPQRGQRRGATYTTDFGSSRPASRRR